MLNRTRVFQKFIPLSLLAVFAAGNPVFGSGSVAEAEASATEIGLHVGEKAPGFALKDQHGVTRTLAGYTKKGIVALLFYRSADW